MAHFYKKTVKDIDLHGKTVLLRADYNVPVDEHGRIANDYRITQSVQTVEFILKQGAKLVICSHLGRPEGQNVAKYSLAPVAKRLSELLDKKVQFVDACIGDEVTNRVSALNQGDVLLLENLRFHAEEEKNDPAFAQQLAKLADIFVEDGFGVVHRAHASTEGITRFLPSVAGLLLEDEVTSIMNAMENPERPLMAIVGGAKIADKIGVLKRFIEIADIVAVGGAMANTFLFSQGTQTGHSKIDRDDIELADEILELARNKAKREHFVFYMPQDGVVATEISSKAKTRIVDWGAHVFADISNYPKRPRPRDSHIGSNEMILDIGPFSGAFIAGATQLAKTVIWNGSMGVTETKGLLTPTGPFSHGTEQIVSALTGQLGHKPVSLVGGGDTVSYIEDNKLTDRFTHVSTGGGASLELMAGKKLPGVEALLDSSDTIREKHK